jgi:serine/threonine-protein kinase
MDPQQGPPQADILIGQTVGNYLVTQKLGEGGMGSVYLAEHPSIGKKVALKVLHQEFSSNPEVADRFFTEAKSVNAIGHPNIVDIVDYGVIQAGAGGREQLVYFIMEFLAGQTLSQVIRAEAPLPPERALMIALQAADALSASHKTGIVHRDLKPDNIILIQRGRDRDFVKLLDFGIAKLTGDSVGSHRTRTGLVLGTPAYMSPEQCEGRANVDHRTDVYALGICLYEMLVGRVPFIGEGYGEILVQHLTQAPIAPSQYRMMSPHVEVVVLKALEKRPDMRYPTMDEFMRAMADPVGFVEAHGGVGQFLQRQLMPSSAPIPSVRLTPTPLTPVPGMMSPLYGGMPSPTTLSSATGHGQVAPQKSRLAFMILGVVVVAAAAAAVMVVLNKNSSKTDGPGEASGSTTGSETVVAKGSETAPGSDTHPAGSGTTTTGSAATGSAAVVATGSATTGSAATGSAAGSANVPTIDPKVKLTITSKPTGAEIYFDGIDTGKQTDTTFEVNRDMKSVTVTLRLKNFDDAVIKNIALDKAEVAEAATLKKKSSGTGHGSAAGSGAGKGSGTGKGSQTVPTKCDTCLERPD